jgi:uncharacterized protein YjbJ (UPF0337 family)
MNWDRVEGEWKQRRGKAVQHWGKVMNDELAAIAGKYEELVGRLQERYGIAKEEANQQVKEFRKIVGKLKQSNRRLIRLQKALHKKEGVRKKLIQSRKTLKKVSRAGKSK